MEKDIRKQGLLYIQQQRFGKKWKRVWCILFKESSCSISRLEFFEWKEGGAGTLERSDKALRKQQENKKVIRLSDCIRVSEVEMEGCPRDCGPFLVETTDKLYLFAAERDQLDDWTHKLCEIAFPMNWGERGGKRSSLQKTTQVEEEEGMEVNSLYSGRETVHEFRVSVRRTEAAERCRLRGGGVLRTDFDSLLLIEPKTGDVLYTWPYRFLRRFGRDKATFSFEAGRRCDSGEGSFEFDTKQGNALFLAVEAAINLQRAVPHRQSSGGGQEPPEIPQPQPRTQPLPQPRCPPHPQVTDGVYSLVKDTPALQNLTLQSSPPQQHKRPPQLSCLEPPVDKGLTGFKSMTLDTRGAPPLRKNQVKNISSCPLPHTNPDANPSPNLVAMPGSQLGATSPERGERGEKGDREERGEMRGERGDRRPPCCGGATVPHPSQQQEPEYSLPFDTIAKSIMADILNTHQAMGLGRVETGQEPPDPLYDSIDESKIRSGFRVVADATKLSKAEHIYDEPEGCAIIGQNAEHPPSSLYDDPEEVRGNAWRTLGTVVDPKVNEYPYDPQEDDYAMPKPPQRALPAEIITNEEEEDSPYDNVMVKMADREKR